MKIVYTHKRIDKRDRARVFLKTEEQRKYWNVPQSIKNHWEIVELKEPIEVETTDGTPIEGLSKYL